jgi:ribonuclease BN (tRNA processing enzyme)
MTVTVRFVGSGDSFGSGGRFQTCILVDGPHTRFAVDFGASSLIALAQQGIEHNSIDAILLTHLHGDHAAGCRSSSSTRCWRPGAPVPS